MSKLKRFIWTLLTAAASANFAFQDDEDFSDHRFRRESSGDYDSSGDGPEVSFFSGTHGHTNILKRHFFPRPQFMDQKYYFNNIVIFYVRLNRMFV